MSIKKQIPNAITCCNLFSGCVAIVLASDGDWHGAAYWIMAAALFDFCDGLAARTLHVFSPIGKELDSLSDVVSFGVAPGVIVYRLLAEACQALPTGDLIPYTAFVIPVFSGLRLAKFNIDERQSTSFIGMPVPAHALFWATAGHALQGAVPNDHWGFVGGVVAVAVLSSLLLVAEIPMFSLKMKSFKWKGNEPRYLLVLCTAVFVSCLGVPGIACGIVLYIALSLFYRAG